MQPGRLRCTHPALNWLAMTEEQALFIADAREMVERLYRDLEELRVARFEGRRRRELAAQIFRRMHTLKGSGASLGFKSAGSIAHEFEGVLDGARLGRIELTDAVLDTFEDALDEIAHALQGQPSDQLPAHVVTITERLSRWASQSQQQGAIAGSLREALPEDISRTLSEYDLQHAREAIREGAKIFIVSAAFPIETFDQGFRELSKLLGESGEIVATMPGDPTTAEEINFRLLYATELLSAETVRRASELGRIEHREIRIESPRADTGAIAETRTRPLQKPIAAPDTSVRIELRQLDDLISTANELFRQTTSALINSGGPTSPATIQSGLKGLRGRFAEFEERLIKLRLVPIHEVFERAAARAGRLAARQLSRQIEFVIAGGDVGIEKSLAEIISDPLLHLVRNAITHGIEDPSTRTAAGKNATGRITLAASNHSGRIHITVTDDGRGIDIDRVMAAAAEQGIAGERLSLDQCLRLIFRPGFSTSPELSHLSGRGIGLDVVDRAMDFAGGEARVATERGAGTTFAMIVPAAFSLVKCVIVRSGHQLYAIDASCVSELNELGSNGSDSSNGDDLPRRDLRSLVGEVEPSDDPAAEIVWQAPQFLRIGGGNGQRYRIGFDALIARQETLVRGLGRYARQWHGVCGAAELFDGNIALMLDLEELIKDS